MSHSFGREGPFRHLFFVLHGMIVPWQYPHSELSSPFLIGDHEFMMDAKRWVASYSAATEAMVVGIPVTTMRLAVEKMPKIRSNMYLLLLRRMARYYWISLATNGSPPPRVAAALISRLALDGLDQRPRTRDPRAAARHRPPHSHVSLGSGGGDCNTRLR